MHNVIDFVITVRYYFCMKLSNYLSDHGAQAKLAATLGISQVLISQWSTGSRSTPIERCYPIEQATKGEVTRKDLRPHDWDLIWPELKMSDKKECVA